MKKNTIINCSTIYLLIRVEWELCKSFDMPSRIIRYNKQATAGNGNIIFIFNLGITRKTRMKTKA